MILAQVVAALVAMSLAVLGFTDNLTPGLLLSLGLVLGAAFAFRHPAWFAIIPDLVPERLVPQAMSLLAVSATVGLIAGPVVWGCAYRGERAVDCVCDQCGISPWNVPSCVHHEGADPVAGGSRRKEGQVGDR